MALFTINRETCNQDGICAEVCPARIIFFSRGEYPSLVTGTEKACIKCGHCVAVCPTGSLTHRDIPVEKCPVVQKYFQLSPDHCEHFLRSRRSIRTYKKKTVPKSEIKRLIEIARHAPSGRNSQDAEWLVLGRRDEIHNLAEIVVNWMHWMIKNNPGEALSMHLDKAIDLWKNGKDIIFRDAPVLIITHAEKDNLRALSTCTLALSYLELAASSMGMGCCWAGYFSRAAATFPPLIEALPLPTGHQSFGAMMLGYPAFRYHRLPLRNPPGITWKM
ncbi:MAG: ferridoxin [Desulfobulbaceae bacterium S3730MH12]|nr:MAG: ferridoxin [Desulfobulbaceae bacterium S3730MH12]OEU83053.1 MAG: ferridoxin [Desulfobulbaceae bacterium C00003063]